MFRSLFGARLPRLALHTLLLALPFAAILAEPALAQNLDPLENMLQTVVDALTGQDAVNVAQSFAGQVELTGVVLTRMDGDARGGAGFRWQA